MTEAETAAREALAKMTPGLKADPYGPPGRYTMDADGCIVIRTESPNDQAALITFQQHTPALLAELDAARAALRKAAETFQHYGDLHAAKPDPVRAQRNYDLAAEMRDALEPRP